MKKEFYDELFSMQDAQYGAFQAKLTPTLNSSLIIGIRTPLLRKFAKEFAKRDECAEFLNDLPHKYYEENNLHGFIIEQTKDFDTLISQLNAFLPYVDNWATCDTMNPKVLKKHTDKLLPIIDLYLKSNQIYTVRFAIGALMRFYLDDKFDMSIAERVCSVKSDEYYINMMIAWFFATALAKQYDSVIPYIAQRRLEQWTHNKTIQKSIESNRISDEHKAYLRGLKY